MFFALFTFLTNTSGVTFETKRKKNNIFLTNENIYS